MRFADRKPQKRRRKYVGIARLRPEPIPAFNAGANAAMHLDGRILGR